MSNFWPAEEEGEESRVERSEERIRRSITATLLARKTPRGGLPPLISVRARDSSVVR